MILVSFIISLHQKDLALLYQIQIYFGVIVKIYKKGENSFSYVVSSIQQITEVIIPHFDMYPLIPKKKADYELFRRVVYLFNKKRHLTYEGITEIIKIKGAMNWGLSSELKAVFPKIDSVSRPYVVIPKIPNPQWIAGFASGEGFFMVKINKSSTTKSGFSVLLRFQITQHSKDELLIKSLVHYLGCGYCNTNTTDTTNFICNKFSENIEKIIAFFRQYPILGVKYQDFLDWCKVVELMKVKAHLTPEGLDQIRLIKSGMNKGRQAQ